MVSRGYSARSRLFSYRSLNDLGKPIEFNMYERRFNDAVARDKRKYVHFLQIYSGNLFRETNTDNSPAGGSNAIRF